MTNNNFKIKTFGSMPIKATHEKTMFVVLVTSYFNCLHNLGALYGNGLYGCL